MLDQDRDEPFETSENSPVNDNGPVLRVIGADVFQIEPFRELVVELDRGALPFAADGVGEAEINVPAVDDGNEEFDLIAVLSRSYKAMGVILRKVRGTDQLGNLPLGLVP